MDAHSAAVLKVVTAEKVAHSLHVHVQFIGDAMHAAAGKRILDLSQFIKCDSTIHSSKKLVLQSG
jgi:hypothetical protein